MAEIEGTIGRQFQSLSIVFVCAVNTKLASLFRLEFALQIYMELTGSTLVPTGNLKPNFKSSPSLFTRAINERGQSVNMNIYSWKTAYI
jgi:hypothetical protein